MTATATPTTTAPTTAWLQRLHAEIAPLHDAALEAAVRHRLDNLTKPHGALGRLEALALQVALVQRSVHPRLVQPQLVVCAADHGLAAQGVSAYPREVTAQMVHNMLGGGAAVSVLARQHGLALSVVDCGVAAPFEVPAGLIAARCCEHGSADCTAGPALDAAQVQQALAAGAALVRGLPGNVLLLGEMGIGNTSAAALIMSALTGRPLADCVGRGTGLDDAGLARKLVVLSAAQRRHQGTHGAPLALLGAYAGGEIVTLTGAVLQACASRRLVIVDGFVTTAAVAVAAALVPAVLPYCIFSHTSAEQGHGRWLHDLGAAPLIDLQLRLGEGSGAALAWPLVQSALLLLEQMASFDQAGVSRRDAGA